MHNRGIKLKRRGPNQQFEVDKQCRLIDEEGKAIERMFGLGVGYPQLTKDLGNLHMYARADSFSLYMNFVGDILLRNLLPKN